jgi:hypothetical protein
VRVFVCLCVCLSVWVWTSNIVYVCVLVCFLCVWMCVCVRVYVYESDRRRLLRACGLISLERLAEAVVVVWSELKWDKAHAEACLEQLCLTMSRLLRALCLRGWPITGMRVVLCVCVCVCVCVCRAHWLVLSILPQLGVVNSRLAVAIYCLGTSVQPCKTRRKKAKSKKQTHTAKEPQLDSQHRTTQACPPQYMQSVIGYPRQTARHSSYIHHSNARQQNVDSTAIYAA